MLNNSPVTEGEAAAALRLAAGSRISQVSLLSYSRTDHHQPRSLSLFPYAQVLYQVSRNRPDRLSDQDNMWYLKVIHTVFSQFCLVCLKDLAPVHGISSRISEILIIMKNL